MSHQLTSDNKETLESEAKRGATDFINRMLHGKMVNLGEVRSIVNRKQMAVDGLLKTVVHSTLNSVSSGITQLKIAQKDLQEVKNDLGSISSHLNSLPELVEKLQTVKEKNTEHTQYTTALNNLKNLFTVPQNVEKIKHWLNEGKLLLAHHCLSDLETSRDELFYALHMLMEPTTLDENLPSSWLEEVEEVSRLLEKQLRVILSRTLNTVRENPSLIVTALRIIEAEEKKDRVAVERQKLTNFIPPGRPKLWKEMLMEVLQESVAQRIEGTQVEERVSHKMWLVLHLELTRQLIFEDLRVVKKCCEPCFPLHYSIVDTFVNMYHNCLAKHLEDIINIELEGNEYVTMLFWVTKTYYGPELMQHPELRVDTSNLEPLLSQSVISQMEESYLKNIEANYLEWMKKAIETDQQDWVKGDLPDKGRFSHSEAPVIIFQMIDQNQQVTRTLGEELTDKVILLSIKHVNNCGSMYRETILGFKNTHFEDRSRHPFFTDYMITAINNCSLYIELAHKMRDSSWKTNSFNDEANELFKTLLSTYLSLRDEAVAWLLEEAFLDLESHFKSLITYKWLHNSSTLIDTICLTFEDYFQDYVHLRPENFEFVTEQAQTLVSLRYISAILQNTTPFRDPEDRKKAALKILREANQLQGVFNAMGTKDTKVNDTTFEAITSLAEVLMGDDTEMLPLDVHALVDKFPDIREDHLIRLINLRGDIQKQDVQDIVTYILKDRSSQPVTMSIFYRVP